MWALPCGPLLGHPLAPNLWQPPAAQAPSPTPRHPHPANKRHALHCMRTYARRPGRPTVCPCSTRLAELLDAVQRAVEERVPALQQKPGKGSGRGVAKQAQQQAPAAAAAVAEPRELCYAADPAAPQALGFGCGKCQDLVEQYNSAPGTLRQLPGIGADGSSATVGLQMQVGVRSGARPVAGIAERSGRPWAERSGRPRAERQCFRTRCIEVCPPIAPPNRKAIPRHKTGQGGSTASACGGGVRGQGRAVSPCLPHTSCCFCWVAAVAHGSCGRTCGP